MKKIKFLLALVVALSLLVTVVMADGLDLKFNVPNNEIELVDGSISLAAYLNMNISSKSSSLVVYYDANIWEISDVYSQAGTAGAKEIANNMANSTITATYTGAQEISKDDAFLSFKATPKAGKEEEAIGSKFMTKPTLSTSNAGTLVKAKGYETITVKAATAADPEKPVITTVAEEKGATIETEDTIYTNIFKGEYSATPVAGVGISEIGIKYHKTDVTAGDAVTLKKNVTIEGGAKVNFKAAILGVAADTELVVEPYTVYAFAE